MCVGETRNIFQHGRGGAGEVGEVEEGQMCGSTWSPIIAGHELRASSAVA